MLLRLVGRGSRRTLSRLTAYHEATFEVLPFKSISLAASRRQLLTWIWPCETSSHVTRRIRRFGGRPRDRHRAADFAGLKVEYLGGCIDRSTRIGPKRVRARAKIRDLDGVTRPVTRYGATNAVAERRLREALRDRIGPSQGDITRETRIRALAEVWLAEMMASEDLSAGTKETYTRALETRVLPALGGLLIRECDVPATDRFLKAVREHQGSSAAKTAKTVTSLLLQLAVRHGALPSNPVREVARISRGSRKARPKALTHEEEMQLLDGLASDSGSQVDQDDVADLIELLDCTGMRIGEALGVRAEVIDLDAGVIEVNATAVRLKGRGTVLQERTKTDAGWRVIVIPPNGVEVCRRRMALAWPNNAHKLLFASKSGRVRNPSNANRDIVAAVKRIAPELGWLTSHTFRKTVATRFDDAGLSARKIADHLGHEKPSMTQDVYMGRGVAVAEAAELLGRR